MKHLIETGTKNYIDAMLKHSRALKERHYQLYYNISVLGGLVLVVGGALLYMYRTKETRAQAIVRKRDEKRYMLEKLNVYNRWTMKAGGTFDSPFGANSEPAPGGLTGARDNEGNAVARELNRLYSRPRAPHADEPARDTADVEPDTKRRGRRGHVELPQWLESERTEAPTAPPSLDARKSPDRDAKPNNAYIPDVLDHLDARQSYHAGMIREVLMH